MNGDAFAIWTKNLKSFEIKKLAAAIAYIQNELKTWKVLKFNSSFYVFSCILRWTKNLKSFEIELRKIIVFSFENELKTWKVLKW